MFEAVNDWGIGAKRQRSPGYPAIDLGKAVRRAEAIYQHEGEAPVPVTAVLSHWGYSGLNGRASRQLAALKKFGLIEDEGGKGGRRIRLSQLGLSIVDPASRERRKDLQSAALMPAIHRELREQFAEEGASDRSVGAYLVSSRGFTSAAARELIAEYRATLRFAGLDGPVDGGGARPAPPLAPAGPAVRGLTIPLAGAAWVKLEGEFPMPEESWGQMMTMLEAMKPGLTFSGD